MEDGAMTCEPVQSLGAYRILKQRRKKSEEEERLANCGEMSIQSINCGFYVVCESAYDWAGSSTGCSP